MTMKSYKVFIVSVSVALIPLCARAQGTVNPLETDFGARLSVSVDKKLVKGLHLVADGEMRLSDNFTDPGRLQAGLGLTYKLNDTFKFGAGYVFIERRNSSGVWNPRHRFYADGKVSFRAGLWRFSLKERFQYTRREFRNLYENNPNSLSLKSRFKVSYKGFGPVTPYTYVELRNVFNDPSVKAVWSTSDTIYGNYQFNGYNDAYINRLRGALGAEWRIDRRNSLDFFVLTDYCYDKAIDIDSSLENLKSLTYDQSLNISAGIGYLFSF